jgi:hypothetical protein
MMNNEKKKDDKEIKILINQKFDELDELMIDYLTVIKNRGGTLGFCVGCIHEKLKYYRGRLNNMCGKFPPY